MRRRIRKRQQALSDLEDQYAYLGQHNNEAADRFLAAAQKAMEEIRQTPGIGWQKPSKNRLLLGIRVWRLPGFPNYLLFYREAGDAIEIIRILHGARDLERRLQK